jgi:hypothetical protein
VAQKAARSTFVVFIGCPKVTVHTPGLELAPLSPFIPAPTPQMTSDAQPMAKKPARVATDRVVRVLGFSSSSCGSIVHELELYPVRNVRVALATGVKGAEIAG